MQIAPQFSAKFAEIPLESTSGDRGSHALTKRFIDLIVAVTVLVVLLPLLCVSKGAGMR